MSMSTRYNTVKSIKKLKHKGAFIKVVMSQLYRHDPTRTRRPTILTSAQKKIMYF